MSKPDAPKRRRLFQPLRLNLPENTGLEGVEVFAGLNSQLESFVREGGPLNSRLQARLSAWRKHLENGGAASGMLKEAGDVRLLLGLWRESPEFLRLAPPDKNLLQRIQILLPRPSRIFLWQFSQLYLEYYQQLPAHKELAAWLRQAFAELPESKNETPEIRAYREFHQALFSKDGAAALLKYTERQKQTLYRSAQQWRLPEASRFYHHARQRYYLEPLEKLRFGRDHHLFAELYEEPVKRGIMPDGLLLGHHVCRLLMDKALAAEGVLPENWRRLILGIMGDPRVPRSAPAFQTWWGRLEKRYVEAMRIWLSHLDLKLFLNILEEVARSHNKQDLLRMFPARKRFLEGLQEQGLIKQSRLLLGSRAENYIRQNFSPEALPEFASVGNADTSLIYLNLGGAHLLEGTHTFQARLYHVLPVPGLADYESRKFSLATLRKYPADHTIRHNHSKKPRWQHDLMKQLGKAPFNLRIDPQNVLSKEDYAYYREFFEQ